MDTKYIDELLKHITEIGPAGCSLLVSKDGKPVYENQAGFADLAGGKPVDETTLFRMYSNTKVVTVIAAMILLERGKFLLNDPVSDYLPYFKDMSYYKYGANNVAVIVPAQNPITISNLLSMTSGITYAGDQIPTQKNIGDAIDVVSFFPRNMTVQEFAKIISDVPLAFEPGTRFHYGYSHDIVAALIEVVSGKSFAEFLNDEIFEPLEMVDTSFSVSAANRDRLAVLYQRHDGELVPNTEDDFRLDPGYKFDSGGGGLISTVRDMEKISRCLCMSEPVLSAPTIELMRRNQLTTPALMDSLRDTFELGWDFFRGYGYGLGVRVILDPAEAGTICTMGEFGWAGAAGTWALIDRNCGLSVFYAHQLMPENMEGYCQPRLRNAIYAAFG